jgi:fructose-1-phosphate kinase PfkB-like protein
MNPNIHTLTGNLLWEQTLTFAAWAAGRTQRAQSATFQVGGKGVNVAKMLMRLGAPATALCFPGGATGADCEAWIRAQGISCRAFPLMQSTRLGLVVRATDQPETTFLGPDASIDSNAAQACADYLDACPAGDVLAICGSLPGWSAAACAPLRAAVERWFGRGPVAVDTYGPPLQWLIEHPAAWVKVNRTEFDALFDETQRAKPLVNRLRSAVEQWAPRAWIVTDGPQPVWFVERGGSPASLTPPPVAEISPTGSGDVLHACLLHAVFNRQAALADALQQALPYAAANASHAGVADFPLENLPPIEAASPSQSAPPEV